MVFRITSPLLRRVMRPRATQLVPFPPVVPVVPPPRPPGSGAPHRRFGAALTVALVGLTVLPFTTTQAAEPRCELRGRPWIEGRVRATAPAQTSRASLARTVDARSGETIDAYLVMPGTLDGRPVLFSEDGSTGRVSFLRSGCPPLQITWRRVEPRPTHTGTKPPNPGLSIYSNAVVFGPRHGRWLGYDQLEYFATPIAGVDALQLAVQDASPTNAPVPARAVAYQSLGTMRLAATIRQGDKVYGTLGENDAPKGQIDDHVFRYSFRLGDGFLGWLTSFFNVPYLFGSAGEGVRNQAERYLGADCADILVAALRRAGLPRLQYTNVGGVIDAIGRSVGPAVVRPCAPGAVPCNNTSEPPLHYGADVRPGDILAVDYVGAGDLPRAWDHIVVLVEDRGPGGTADGILGADDLVADSGDAQGLKVAPLADQGPVRIMVARPKGITAF